MYRFIVIKNRLQKYLIYFIAGFISLKSRIDVKSIIKSKNCINFLKYLYANFVSKGMSKAKIQPFQKSKAMGLIKLVCSHKRQSKGIDSAEM